MDLIGRHEAQDRLDRKLKSPKSELIAILGRRRVGKTFLIREALSKHLAFDYTGLYRGDLEEHLERFVRQLSSSFKTVGDIEKPKSWFHAFDLLASFLQRSRSKKKKVIFLDEFPWLATNKSRFLTAFTDFWNSFAAKRTDLVVVICGSSASWMIQHVLQNKGGLHNRVTERIFLEPFTLSETKEFLQKKGIRISDTDIIQLYMMVGGIPFYLDQMEKGESVMQFIDRTCFRKGAVLRTEYDELLSSLFDKSDKHTSIIEVLQKHPTGLTRDVLLKRAKLKSGGGATSILHELAASGFIGIQTPYGKRKKDQTYKLKDHYTLFYLKYIRNYKAGARNVWTKVVSSPSFKSWSGLAFEQICYEHIDKIYEALGIDGIHAEHSTWHTSATEDYPGVQVDLLIDRADNVINLCEIKYASNPFVIKKDYAKKLQTKVAVFEQHIPKRKVIFPTMITSYGLVENTHSGFIQQTIEAKDLF